MKVNFFDDEHFIIYYFCDKELKTEEEFKLFFKMLNQKLYQLYEYEFVGFYHVDIYVCGKLFVMEFENIDDYGKPDFDITVILNSVLLYEFEDSDMIWGKKIYYQNKFYVELEKMVDSIYLFEYGNIIYGKKVDEVLKCGMLISC